MRYYLIRIRKATIKKKTKQQVLAGMWRNWNSCALLAGM